MSERAQMGLRIPAPLGYRWATGGGDPIGCNGLHLARPGTRGTLCGLVGRHTPADPRHGARMCGNCARIAKVPRDGLTRA